MNYEGELQLFQRILNQFHLPYFILPTDKAAMNTVDMGLRNALGLINEPDSDWDKYDSNSLQANTIYYLRDGFSCRYVMFLLPGTQPQTLLTIGPYVTEEIDQQWLLDFSRHRAFDPQWQPIFENYFRRVPYLQSEDFLVASLNALGEQLWGMQNFSSEQIAHGIPETWTPLTTVPDEQTKEEILSGIHSIQKSYADENRLIMAVSRGQLHKARLMMSGIPKSKLEQRTEPIRNTKNYSIILNTLLRKAAEQGGVHPIYIDRLSSEFARKIENTARWEDFMALWNEMIHQYCLLVNKHSMRDYSNLVQQVIARIDFDLSADLSLKATAENLNVNASYLSALFKKETGLTLTDYVAKKRMEHAAYLLTTTQLSISSVAQSCGIQDDNYFAKLFKRYYQKTPKQFRQEHHPFKKK